MQPRLSPTWPVLSTYEGDTLDRVAMPLGGVGTGCLKLGGRGDLRDWEIVNRAMKGWRPDVSFFVVRAQSPGSAPVARIIEGEPSLNEREHGLGYPIQPPGLPRFRHARFDAAFPLAQVSLHDTEMPLQVRIEAFNPLIPGDAERSGLPVTILRFVLINDTSQSIDATVCGSLQNFIGRDVHLGKWLGDNDIHLATTDELTGLLMSAPTLDTRDSAWGTLALATTATEGVSHFLHRRCGGDFQLQLWDDLLADGALDPGPAAGSAACGSLAVRTDVPAHSEVPITFLIAWHFPNRLAWMNRDGTISEAVPGKTPDLPAPEDVIGNYYTTRAADAWDAARQTARQLPALEHDTVRFVTALATSNVPTVIKEAALANSAVLHTQTCFRTPDGRLLAWEGLDDNWGSCFGSCTHVWNYEQTTAHLFGELSRTMREIEFNHALRDDGMMSFRVHLPLAERAQEWDFAAADGQMGCLVKLYRDWKLCGDHAMLHAFWPQAKAALSFTWIPNGWDADRDGVMEGCQHNTYDCEFYGPNPLMASWYLAALRAAEELALAVGDTPFADTCRDLFTRGSQWIDAHLFNGDYYEQHIQPLAGLSIPTKLHRPNHAPEAEPTWQLGAGCLIDQLLGQVAAYVAGLGPLLDRDHMRAALQAIMRHNFREDFHGFVNYGRAFALADEAGTLMCSYPRGNRPKSPFPYSTEVWTGCEYPLAALLIYEGMHEDALRVIQAVRDRHDGRRRNPFDEPECGRHYGRSMSAWTLLLAWTGFSYDATTGALSFAKASEPGTTWFWSTGTAWGTVSQLENMVKLETLYGEIQLKTLTITGLRTFVIDSEQGTSQQWQFEPTRLVQKRRTTYDS